MADPLTHQILAAAFEVSNTLGPGFLEKVYHQALRIELEFRGLRTASNVHFPVTYKGHPSGDYYADLVVESAVLIEIKCADSLHPAHIAQCLNYLAASGLDRCLLLNFQHAKLEYKRLVRNYPRSSASICG